MAETAIGSLVVDLALNSAAFIADMAKSASAVRANTAAISKSLDGLRKNFLTVSKVAGGVLAGDFGIRAFRQLQQLTAESLKLAESMGGELGQAASDAERKLESLSEAFQFGVAQGFLEGFGNALDNISQDKLDALTKAGAALGDALGKALSLAADKAEAVPGVLDKVGLAFSAVGSVIGEVIDQVDAFEASALDAAGAAGLWVNALLPERLKQAPQMLVGPDGRPLDQMIAATGDAAAEAAPKIEQYNAAWRMMDWQTSVEGVDNWNNALATGREVIASTNSPLDTYRAKLAEIQTLVDEQAPGAQRAAQAQMQAAAIMASSYAGAASDIVGSLGQVFEGNKGFAVASATMNVLEGITKALTLPFPLNWAQVAAVGAAGFAQVRQIMATSPSSRGGGGSVPKNTGGSAASGASRGSSSASGPMSSVNVTLVGQGGFSSEQVRGLIAQINEAVGDGARIRVS